MSEKVIFIFIDSIILEKIKLGIINRKTKNKNSDKENKKKINSHSSAGRSVARHFVIL